MAGILQGSSRYDGIQTPRALYDRLNEAYRFNYDAFAAHEDHLASCYSTIEGTYLMVGREAHPDTDLVLGERRPLKVHMEDGLELPWEGRRVYLNPPFSRLREVTAKCVAERNEAAIIVALLKVDTSTRWWQTIAPYAHIDYLPRRVSYVHPAPPSGWAGASFASAVLVLKKDWMA